MRRAIFVIVTFLAIATPASAQIEDCAGYKRLIDALVAGTDERAAINLLDVDQNPRCFTVFIASHLAFTDFIQHLESSRADKQTGAPPASIGGTSVIAQGPVAKVLSVATEYGVLTQAISKRVITVRGNLAGVPAALVRQDVFPFCDVGDRTAACVSGSLLGMLKRFSFAVSFDPLRTQSLTVKPDITKTGSGDTQPVTFTGSSREISAVSVHIDLWNRRDTSSTDFAVAWHQKAGAAIDKASDELLAASSFIDEVKKLADQAWTNRHLSAIRQAGNDRAKIIAALHAALDDLWSRVRTLPHFEQDTLTLRSAFSRFGLAQYDLVESIATANVLAFEYTHTRPTAQPGMSNYRVIFDHPLSKTTKVVANGAVTFYDSVPAGQTIVKRYRDAQAGVELDQSLGDLVILGPAVFSAAGYFQYQHAPALLQIDPSMPVTGVSFTGLPTDAKSVFATAGNIFLVQSKLSLVPTGSAVKIPLSITWSNRTELIDKPVLRGQIGISYDFDSLFAGLGK